MVWCLFFCVYDLINKKYWDALFQFVIFSVIVFCFVTEIKNKMHRYDIKRYRSEADRKKDAEQNNIVRKAEQKEIEDNIKYGF